ncbi:MAG: hypothetical protein ACFFE8_01685 [Candidatus Heimdallarchaeota archaeon]
MNNEYGKRFILGTLLIFVVFLSSVPILLHSHLASERSSLEEVEIDRLTGLETKIEIPRLMSESGGEFISDFIGSTAANRSHSRFSIGQRAGPGGGSYSVYDSFNWTGSESLTTQNTLTGGLPTDRSDSLTISNPTGFSRQYGEFNISGVTATSDWRLIENLDNTGRGPVNSDPNGLGYYEVAMSFNITEEFANITNLRIINDFNPLGSPQGTLYIVNSTGSGNPDDSQILSEKLSLLTTGVQWDTYTFSSPVLLTKGTYFVVMNDTLQDPSNYWLWYWQHDLIDDGSEDGTAYYKSFDHSTWLSWGIATLPLQIEALPVEFNGVNYVNKSYYSPSVLAFSYNTSVGNRELTSFTWFTWFDTTTHSFKTNTSVSFDLAFIANYTYSLNPISAASSYLVSNNSISMWNLTFSTTKANITHNIRNHIIRIVGIEPNWNGTSIYWNDSSIPEYPSLTNNVNVTWDGDPLHKYTFGNTTMVVNSSALAGNVTWRVLFEAPNYLSSFNMSRGALGLQLPYEANVTDTIDLNFVVPESGGNISYWIEYYGLSVYANLDFDSVNQDITDPWNINDSVSQTTNVNGTYNLQGFWISSDKTKAGTFTRDLNVIINTTLTVNSTDFFTVVIGEKITLWANYTSNHNSTPGTLSHIKNAKIWANSSWPQSSKQNVTMNQPSGQYYNSSFTTDGELPGTTGTIAVTTQLEWFVNWTIVLTVKFIGDSGLTANVTSISLEWRENATIRVDYNDTSGASIGGGTITVDGNNAIETNNIYYYQLNTTDYAGIGTYSNLVINATHPDYVSKEIVFTLVITPGNTDIAGRSGGQALTNITGGVSKSYANSSADDLSINLRYYYILADDTLNTGIPTVVSRIPYDAPVEESNFTWTIFFHPNETGAFLINVTFALTNYNSSTFVFNLTIAKSNTAIYSEIGTSATTYYNESLDFFLLYNNTDYNENISGLSEGAGITLNNTNVSFLNRTGEYYWFRISPTTLPVGIHSTNITFEHVYFESSFIIVSFEVLPRPTDLTGRFGSQPLINDSTVITQFFANSSADNLIINLEYYDVLTSNVLDTSIPLVVSLIPNIGTLRESNLSWTLTFNPNQTGVFLINITFNLTNYTDALFIFHLTINKAQTAIYSSLSTGFTTYHGVNFDFFLLYNNTNYNENITGLTAGGGIVLNNTNVSFLNRTGDLYWFRLNPISLMVGSYATNITFSHIYFESSFIVVSFEVLPRPTDLTGQSGSQPLINDTTIIIQLFANSTADSVKINLEYYDVLTSNVLDTGTPLVVSLIPNIGTIKEGNLSWTLTFNPNQTGLFLINVTFSLTNYTDALFIFHLTVSKAQTSLYSNLSPTPTVYYDESFDFFLLYNNTNYNENITGLLEGSGITLNNTYINFLNRTGAHYWFRLSPNALTLGIYATNITFTHIYFESTSIIVSFEVLPRLTDLTGQFGSQPLINDTTIIAQFFANSSADSVAINLEYYDIFTSNVLDTGSPLIMTLIPVIGFVKEANRSWTLTFNPNQTGNFLINITFSLTNYSDALFIFHLTINKAQTDTYNSLSPTPTVYHNDSFDFFLLYNNTNYNENITGLTLGSGITLNNTNINFLNRTGDHYWFRLSPTTLSLGLHATNITFEHVYFESSFIVVSFEVLPRPTDLTGQSGSQPLINDTTVIIKFFANSSADSVVINLEYYDVFSSNVLDTSLPLILTLIPLTGTVKEANLSWTLTFNPNQTGVFLINISFSLANYTAALFVFHLTVSKAQTGIYSSLPPDPEVYYNESVDFFLVYNNTNYNENITGLTVGSAITLNNTFIGFLNRTGDHYWFRLSQVTIPLGNYATNITFSHIYFETSFIIISFNVLARPSDIRGQYSGQPIINDSTIINQYFANSSADSVVINLEYYDVLTSTVLDTGVPLVVSLIPTVGTVKESNLSWTLTFDPDQTGAFLINVTFNLTNHTDALFIFHLTVSKAQTSIYGSLSLGATVYYNESLDFFLLYNNTNYNENITGLTEGVGITLNNTKINFLNRTGNQYWFRLGSSTLPLGIHSTNITFEHVYFESSFIVANFEVLPRPTDLTGQSGSQPLINDTTIINQYFANSSVDSVTINLEYYDLLTSNILDTGVPLVVSLIPTTGTVKESNLSWTLTFNPNRSGNFFINITFSLANYTDALFIFHLTVFKATTSIYNSLLPDPKAYYSESVDFFLLYNNTNYNENITGLLEGSGINLNNTYVSFLNRTGNNYWFRLNANSQTIGSYTTNITFSHVDFESSSIIVSYEVLARPTSITGQYGSQPLTNDTTIITRFFANSSADNVIINLEYYDVLTSNVLDTGGPFVLSLIPSTGTIKESNLSWTLTFNPNRTGTFLINITFSLLNHSDALFIFHLTVLKATTAIYSELPANSLLYYSESMDFFLLYNNTNYNENITGLTVGSGISLNNTYLIFLNQTGDFYWFRLNPVALPLGIYGTNITFEHVYFKSSFILVSFEVLPRTTDLTGQTGSQPLINDTTVITQFFANSSADSVTINLEYYDVLTSNVLDTSAPFVVSLIPTTGTVKESNLSWTLTFNPNQTGIFLINVSFSLANHTDALFVFHLTVNKAPTAAYNSLPTDPKAYYNESVDFFLVYNNTYYNENITGLIVGSGIALNNSKVSFLNRTGDQYWFRLSPSTLPLGIQVTNISFSHVYFESSSIVVNFEVIPRPTDLTGQFGSQPLINDTTIIAQFFANSSADSVAINLEYYDVFSSNVLDTSLPQIYSLIPSTGTVKESNLSWTLTFNPNQTGIFLINVTFSLANHTNALFIFHLTVDQALTDIYNELPPISLVYYNESSDFFLLYNNTNYNENITGLTDNDGITINNSNIVFLNRTGNYYWFRLTPNPIGPETYGTNITFGHVYFESSSVVVLFEVLPRPTDITGQFGSQPLINDTTVIFQYFSNGSVDSVTINFDYYDVFTSNTLDSDAPQVESLIPISSTSQESNLSWTLTFNPNQTGVFLINITIGLTNYTDALFVFHLTVNKATTAIYNGLPPDPTLYYGLSTDFYLLFNNTIYNENITGLTEGTGIILNNTNVSFLNRTGDLYWFRLSPISLAVGIYATNITLSHADFESSFVVISFEVLPSPTGINGQYGSQPLTNDSTVVNLFFANSTADSISFNLEYYDTLTSNVLNTGFPLILSMIPTTSTVKESNLSWTLTFNPNMSGIFLINFTFNLANYESAHFILHLTVEKAQTSIYNGFQSVSAVYYDLPTDFYLLFNNTNYNENITGLTVGSGITLNNTKVSFLNRTADYYWFRISSTTLPLGNHATNITFDHAYFESSSVVISFDIITHPTDMVGRQGGQLLVNDTTIVTRYFSNSSGDAVIINLAYLSGINGTILDTNTPQVVSMIPITGTVKESNLSWTFTFNPNKTGIFLINVTATLANYEDALFIFHFSVNKAPTAIYNSLPLNPDIAYDTVLDFFLIYNNTKYNENITGLTEGSGIIINNTDVGFLNRTGDLYWFRLSPSPISPGFHATNITFLHLDFESSAIIINFNVFNRSLIIDNLLSNPGSGQNIDYLLFGEVFYFNVFINDSLTLLPINSSSVFLPNYVVFLGTVKEGNHSFSFNASKIGQFLDLKIVFALENYESVTYNISFVVAPAITGFGLGTTPVNGSILGNTGDFWLTDSRNISIRWIETVYGSSITDPTPELFGDWVGFITYIEFSKDGRHIFSLNGTKLGSFRISIIFETQNYSKSIFLIEFNISVIPTFEPVVTFPSELIVGQLFPISLEQWLSLQTLSVPLWEIHVLNGSSSIFAMSDHSQTFPITINISTENFRQGIHTLTIFLTSTYGYENQTFEITFNLIGREILITILRDPEVLVQGADFTIIAILEYASLRTHLSGIGAGITLSSLEGMPVTFKVDILYLNGTVKTLTHSTEANATGVATFLVGGQFTHNADGIQGITVTTGINASAKSSSATTPSNFIDDNKFASEGGDDPLSPLYPLIWVSPLIVFLIFMTPVLQKVNRRRKKDGSKVQRIETPSGKPGDSTPSIEKKESPPPAARAVSPSPQQISGVHKVSDVKDEKPSIPEISISEESRWINKFPKSFSNYENELKFLFKLVVERAGAYRYQTSLKYLLSRAPKGLSKTNLEMIFNDISVKTDYFEIKRRSIVITEKGKKIALSILNSK